MATYDADLQAAVDATSIAHLAGQADDIGQRLREELAEREIETQDQGWIDKVVEGIRSDPNFMVDFEPSDYDPQGQD